MIDKFVSLHKGMTLDSLNNNTVPTGNLNLWHEAKCSERIL